MPMAALRPCAAHGCPALVRRGRCPAHTTQVSRERGSASARGYGASWRRLRALVLLQEPFCRACRAQGRVTASQDVDHIRPRALGGTDDRGNLQGLCHACHSAKTLREQRGGGAKSLEPHILGTAGARNVRVDEMEGAGNSDRPAGSA
jgi:5-methylcytosine-specific restriction protein A